MVNDQSEKIDNSKINYKVSADVELQSLELKLKINLSQSEIIARAMSDLRIGLPVVVSNSTAAISVLSAESANDERLLHYMNSNNLLLVLTSRRASTLKARIYDGDITRIEVPTDAGAEWIRSVADPTTDLNFPMKGPFVCQRGGSVELHRAAITLSRKARLLPAVLTWQVEKSTIQALETGLTQIELDTLSSFNVEPVLQSAAKATLPLNGWPEARINVFRVTDGSEDHCAIIFGEPSPQKAVHTRLHSACLTGDVLGSLKCDCGKQLKAAIDYFETVGSGVLLYLNQEGRGIGLLNKIRAYGLQDQGYDTVEANHRLGFEDDERNFSVGATLLKQLGFHKVCLLTNNPAKVKLLEENGISVEKRIPLLVDLNKYNTNYMTVKAVKSGHIL